MAARLGVFLVVSLFATLGPRETPLELIVWNVGQGQWATIRTEDTCYHLDMGGEFAPWKQISTACRELRNVVSLSHWDMDHISFVGRARFLLPQICLLNRPEGDSSEHKMWQIDQLSCCRDRSVFNQWSDPAGHTANDKSWVVEWKGVLAPGDSTQNEEKHWAHELPHLRDTRLLILGHHGSRTSTSEALLDQLPHVKMAISSARLRRYGHPHAETIEKLRARQIPLLRTEDWGTLHFEL